MTEIKPKSKKAGSRRGGARPGAGRPAGSANKATIDQKARLSDLARSHADIAFATLVDVAQSSTSSSARVAAACAILDRAFGRPGAGEPEPEKENPMLSLLHEIQARAAEMQRKKAIEAGKGLEGALTASDQQTA